MINTLARLGTNFDCASPGEIRAVLKAGVEPSRILYAHPCKKIKDIKYAVNNKIPYTVFDNIDELKKLSLYGSNLSCLLRISAFDPKAQCILGNKYGAPKDIWESLLYFAKKYNIKVEGVSFHVGSGASSPDAYREAILDARYVFDIGREIGLSMTKLDIGGGFMAIKEIGMSSDMKQVINENINKHFPESYGVDIWAEPGRYFAEHAWTLFTRIIGKREIDNLPQYYLTCGLYGMFNNMVYDHAIPQPWIPISNSPLIKTTLFGPTCDGIDKISDDAMLPQMEIGNWIAWPSMGAYTYAGACDFNGIHATRPNFRMVRSQKQ